MTTATAGTHRLGPIESIPLGEGREYMVQGAGVAVFRTRSGEVFATQARCPHRGAPLADGLTGGGRVVCPFHAYAFSLATGEPFTSDCPGLKTYPVVVEPDGEIVLCVEEVDQAQSCLG